MELEDGTSLKKEKRNGGTGVPIRCRCTNGFMLPFCRNSPWQTSIRPKKQHKPPDEKRSHSNWWRARRLPEIQSPHSSNTSNALYLQCLEGFRLPFSASRCGKCFSPHFTQTENGRGLDSLRHIKRGDIITQPKFVISEK